MLFAAGCTKLGDGLLAGRSRDDCHNRDPHSGSGGGSESVEPEIRTDTTFFLSAVRFDESYDWRRDTVYGGAGYEILFYRDFEQVLSIPSSAECASPDLDSHHIIDGHLYTEAATRSRTTVGRDGQTLFSFEGREILRGLLPVGDDVYTLSESRSGDGFTLRKNGNVLFRRESGSVFGDLADPSYRPYGALYKDLDKVSFCYRAGKDKDIHYYVVQDAVETMTALNWTYSVEDLKVWRGYPVDAEETWMWYEVEDGRIWLGEEGSDIFISGLISSGYECSSVAMYDDPGTVVELCEGSAYIYHGADRDFALRLEEEGRVTIFGSDSGYGESIFTDVDYTLMSPSCAAMVGDGAFCAALTCRTGRVHRIFCDGALKSLVLHGYLSCIRAEVSFSPSS